VHGGNSPQYIFVWYFIALQTLVEPRFYSALLSPRRREDGTARRAHLDRVLDAFDFLATFHRDVARALMPHCKSTSSYPALAIGFLTSVVQGLFYLGLLATVMSTVRVHLIGGVNFGRDLLWRMTARPTTRA